MSELIIHIGAHKTATTTIQKMLVDSAADLAAAGLVYPRISWFQFAQHRLAFALKGMSDPVQRDRPDPEAEIAQLNATLDRHPDQRILISSEELFSVKPEAIALFREKLRVRQVRILAFVRRPDEMLLSIYNQKTKSPDNGFARLLEYYVNHPRQIDPDISYGVQIGKWADAFGWAAIDLRTYESAPAVETFLAAAGLPLPDAGTQSMNRSAAAPVVEIMRLSKAFGFDPKTQRALYDLANRQFAGAARVYLSDEARARIVRSFQAENDALFARLGRDNPYRAEDLVPVEPDGPRPNLSYRDLMGIIETLLERGVVGTLIERARPGAKAPGDPD